jgi:hypothetical protein
MTLLNCSSFESSTIAPIVRGWHTFVGNRPEYAKMKTTILHLVELADGMDFRQCDIDEMRTLIASMDDSKPDVKKVKAWLNK